MIRKKLWLLAVILLAFLLFPLKTYAKNPVNIYLFYGKECPHCAEEKAFLDTIEEKYDNVKVYKYEVWHNPNNSKLLENVSALVNVKVKGVPFTIVGDRVFAGYSNSASKRMEEIIVEYSNSSYNDIVGRYLGVADESVNYKDNEEQEEEITSSESAKEENTSQTLDVPFIGKVSLKSLSLPVIAILMGSIDGFNPCAMWILLFLISMLVGMKDKKRMWTLGLTFLTTSALVYLIFMLAWLNFASFISKVAVIRIIIALIALVGGIINLYHFFKRQEDGCHVVAKEKRSKIFTKIKNIVKESKFALAFFGIIALAFSVNIIELACSAGLPVAFTQILVMNNLSQLQYVLYVLLYILFFLLDDIIVFIIAMVTLKVTGISTKYSKFSSLVGGIIMILIGILLVFKPEWLMFNFS